MAYTGVVCKTLTASHRATKVITQREETTPSSFRSQQISSVVEENEFDSMSLVRGILQERGLPEGTQEVIFQSWRPGTRKQYDTYIRKWIAYCSRGDVNPSKPPINAIMNFLTELHNNGLGYSGLNTAKSAISSITCIGGNAPCGEHPLIKRMMKGFFNIKPSLPRYSATWSPDQVLTYLDDWKPPSELSLRNLTFKVVML